MTGPETISALISALNDMDVDAFAGLLSDDVIVEHVPLGRVIEGKQAVIEWFAAMTELTEANNVEIRRLCENGSTIWAERIDRHRIGGQWHEIPIMGVLELDDTGKVTLMRDYFDSKLTL
jgi:limonene-1,2-epoxide hydrolase